MLRIIQSKSAAHAKSYFKEGLSREDYYSEGQEIAGTWNGKAAERLGLRATVSQDDFHALCDNLDPATGARLTARTNSDRTIGYDFNFHSPKSATLLYSLTKDERILTACRGAVSDTMKEMETDMQTRVRIGGVQEKRETGNMVWAEFVHFTARPVEGKPDPHLHAHCYTFNATFDETEQRWKAGHFGNLKRDAPYYEATFHARFAERMAEMGYGIEAKGKFWEVARIPETVVERFSQRKNQIEALAQERGITDPAEKDKLGALSREKKVKSSMHDLSAEWASRLTPEEKAALEAVRQAARGSESRQRGDNVGERAIDHALAHVFERASIASEKDVLEAALRHGIGRLSVDEAKAAFVTDKRILHKSAEGENLCTTREVRDQENALIAFAKETRDSFDPIKSGPHEFVNKHLNDGQRRAVEHVLSSYDGVTLLRGKPGTGKTTLTTEAVAAINAAGYGVVALAPTAESSRVALREAGFAAADTVEGFLQSPAKQKHSEGKVIWVDEAGLLSAPAMGRLFDVAKAKGCRVVLAGDTGQHSPVTRGDAMRLLERHADLRVPEVTQILRQKEDNYRKAVEAMSSGKIDKAFSTLEKMKAFVVDADIDRLHARVADDYVGLLKSGKEALIIAPQHQEGLAITEKVRARLRHEGQLKGPECSVLRLTNLKLTAAERADHRQYQAGQVVQFVQNTPGFRRGERVSVIGREGEQVAVQTAAGERKRLPLTHASRFQLYAPDQIALAAGDKIRVTHNGFAKTGQQLHNGTLHTVASVRPNGEIELKNKTLLAAKFGHLTHGYYVTSHGSQSKTVDWNLLAQSSMSFNAGSREQMNVSLSRGRDGIRIYTDDKAELRERAKQQAARENAVDLFGPGKTVDKRPENRRVIMSDMNRWCRAWQQHIDRAKTTERSRETDLCKEARGASKGQRRGLGLEISL
jgi:conjugative relaxase-like TrwC/TraI family protein